ncbi:uncharacterized protein BCR38DRAFT_336857 [Pseudomassariella vexata]|uniref:Ribosomal RNA-processing protein 40 n=1 Tax=Pseudomassariella vexata TaxID=1141098 RepID=A0A1Y2E8N4_9PEZI|nr:uncharacterized protein BCR38DRAFT_336857 [Pseudomassariella vexata]ORY67646.1 hypothetical protein BCR38DRAFT_336857 [Pseudomassariella vexata]
MERTYVLPGDSIDPTLIPSHPTRPLKLGLGLKHIPPSDIIPTIAGELVTDRRKNSMHIEYNGGRYVPIIGDLVIGTVQKTAADYYYVGLSDYTSNAILPQLAFEGASKKTRPNLAAGALVYARVSLANRHMDPELECVSTATGKADGLGPLVGGMIYTISLGMARRLRMAKLVEKGKVAVIEDLSSAGLAFEMAVGCNGKLWVNSENIKTILAVGRAVKETDEKNLGVEAQRKLARKLIKEMA